MIRTCRADELVRFTADLLVRIGMRADDARRMAEVIVSADLAGHESCGVRQVPGYVEVVLRGAVDPAARPVVEHDRGSLLRVDGGRGFGHVTFRYVTDLAVERAGRFGICGIAVHSTHHLGRVADFCDAAARQGVVTLFFLNQSGGGQVVVPPGGTAARLATNPIAVGVPRSRPGGPHLVVDLATSAVAAGRLAEWRDRGHPDPPDWVTPEGLLTPFGGVKGFGLSLVVEALAGALSGAGTVGPDPEVDAQGGFVIGLDVAALRPLAEVTADLDAALEYVRDVPLEDPVRPVRLPGEGSAATRHRREADGVPVRDHTWRRLLRLAEDHRVRPPAADRQQRD